MINSNKEMNDELISRFLELPFSKPIVVSELPPVKSAEQYVFYQIPINRITCKQYMVIDNQWEYLGEGLGLFAFKW